MPTVHDRAVACAAAPGLLSIRHDTHGESVSIVVLLLVAVTRIKQLDFLDGRRLQPTSSPEMVEKRGQLVKAFFGSALATTAY